MRNRLRRSLTAILVAIFGASGISSQACLAVQLATTIENVASHTHSDAHSMTGMSHHDHQMHGQIAAGDHHPPATDDHASKKCCSLCVVSGIQPSVPGASVVFVVSSDIATAVLQAYFDHPILVDPGIPKRIV
jgi:hypothetical protein